MRAALLIGLFILSHHICDVRGASCSPSSPLRFSSGSTASAFLPPLPSIRGRSSHFVLGDTRRHGIASSLAGEISLRMMIMRCVMTWVMDPLYQSHNFPSIHSTSFIATTRTDGADAFNRGFSFSIPSSSSSHQFHNSSNSFFLSFHFACCYILSMVSLSCSPALLQLELGIFIYLPCPLYVHISQLGGSGACYY